MSLVSRLDALRHIAAINAYGPGSGAKCADAEMIVACDGAIADGQAEWRDDALFPGRFLTDSGRAALAAADLDDSPILSSAPST